MIEFFNKIFGRQPSKETAKERLRLVLLSDHIALAPDLMDDLKRELVDVISRFVEVDRSKIEVNFEQQEKTVAMMANIPILSVHPPKPKPPAPPEPALATVTNGAGSTTAANGGPKRRRRRRKSTNGGAATGPTATSTPAPAT